MENKIVATMEYIKKLEEMNKLLREENETLKQINEMLKQQMESCVEKVEGILIGVEVQADLYKLAESKCTCGAFDDDEDEETDYKELAKYINADSEDIPF